MKEYRIEGAGVNGISDLYKELNRELMVGADWRMGQSLDALNDALYGVDSEIREGHPVVFIWHDHAHSRATLGYGETLRWLLDKLSRPETFNQSRIQSDLDDLRSGVGKTYFELILEVFADHPLIELRLR